MVKNCSGSGRKSVMAGFAFATPLQHVGQRHCHGLLHSALSIRRR